MLSYALILRSGPLVLETGSYPLLAVHFGGLQSENEMLPRVVLADDHAAVRDKVCGLLASRFDVVAKVADGGSLVEAATRLHPDLLVLDISMPVLNGIEAARRVREAGSAAAIIFLTVHEDPEFIEAALATGARGYVFKSRMATDLLPAIRAALADARYVSPRFSGAHPETQ